MKNEILKGKKPIKTINKNISHKGCNIIYTVSDYGLGSSGFAYLHFFSKGEFVVACLILEEPSKTLKKAESEIIKRSKNWINTRLIPIKKED